MSIFVGELVSQLRTRSRVVSVKLGDVELLHDGDGAGILRLGGNYYNRIEDVPAEHQNQVITQLGQRFLVGGERLSWGDRNTQMLATFLKGPGYKYILRESLEWQSAIIAHHTRKAADNDALVYIEGNNIGGIYHPDDKIIPLAAVAERVANVFGPQDRANVLYSPDQVEINVTSNVKTVTVPGIPGVAGRPMPGTVDHPDGRKVGDLSAGGVRIIIQPGKPERAPIVQEFWERLVCTNGMTRMISGSQVNLRGRTVEEILDEMENVMRAVYEGLDGSAENILHSAETRIPGATSDFIREVAQERGINAATILRLQERAAILPPEPTVYDVTQIFTDMANEDGLPVVTRRNLQALGGTLTAETDDMVHRCANCERPLPRNGTHSHARVAQPETRAA